MTTEEQGMTTEPETDDLDFSHADMETDGAPSDEMCVACQRVLDTQYFDINGRRTCVPCGTVIRDGVGTPGSRFRGALLFGLGASALCSLVWWGIRELTGYELGIIAIAVGYLVGIAVRNGSGYRGGAAYQALAIGLSYSAIAVSYVPVVANEIMTAGDIGGLAYVIAVPIAFAVPVLSLFEGGVIGFLILLFALYEAWKLNAKPPMVIQGPFDIAPVAAAPAAPEPV